MSRIFKAKRRVRVGDCDKFASLRPDAIARYLQDIGYDDTHDLGLGDGGIWVARSIEIKNNSLENWPMRNETIELETYCGGVGKVVAQRNVNLIKNNIKVVETKTLWVSLDDESKLTAVPDWLMQTYPEAEKVSSKRILNVEPKGETISFPLRQSDLDINDHANNSVAFDAVFEAMQFLNINSFQRIYVEYHTPIDISDDTSITIEKMQNGFHAWIITQKHVACSIELETFKS